MSRVCPCPGEQKERVLLSQLSVLAWAWPWALYALELGTADPGSLGLPWSQEAEEAELVSFSASEIVDLIQFLLFVIKVSLRAHRWVWVL